MSIHCLVGLFLLSLFKIQRQLMFGNLALKRQVAKLWQTVNHCSFTGIKTTKQPDTVDAVDASQQLQALAAHDWPRLRQLRRL